MTMKNVRRSTILGSVFALVACSSDDADGQGRVAFSTWGEDYIEQEIPADEVEDGWTLRFDKFLITLGRVRVAETEGGAAAAEMPGFKLFDMVQPGVKPVVSFDALPAKPYRFVSFEVAPATGDTELAGATDADKERMVAGGFSVFVDGAATKDGVEKTFAWGFTERSLYARCVGELAGRSTEGVVVTNGGTDAPQITIHGDHLFYDDLQAEDAKVRFGSLAAADADGDGVITQAELAAVELASIPASEGTFGTGSVSGVHDLGAFVAALSRTLAHFRGEGECFAREP